MKMLVSVIVMSFVMVGCGSSGSGSSSSPAQSLDNSVLTNTSNQYGYFGDDVVFVDTKIVRDRGWTFFTTRIANGTFTSDGEFYVDGYTLDYGVSRDGRSIKTSDGVTLIFKSIMHDAQHITDEYGNESILDCYKVSASDGSSTHEVDMCPR